MISRLLGDLTSGSQLTGTGPETFELRLWEVSRAELGVSYALANEAAVTVGTPNFLGQVNLPVPGSGHGLNLVAGSGVGALSIPILLATRTVTAVYRSSISTATISPSGVVRDEAPANSTLAAV